MGYIMPLLGLAASFLSMLGIFLVFYYYFKTEPSFLPLLTVSTVTILTYIGGLFGKLGETVFVLYIIGIAALCYSVFLMFRRKLNVKKLITSPGVWIFGLLCIYFVIQMRGRQSLHVDNFSHWAALIKEMCLTDAFPVEGSAITFRNYTPGSAVFIYYVCNAVGYTEGTALMAQGFLLAAAMATFFCKAKFRSPITLMSLVAVCAVSVSIPKLLDGSLHYYNFLVDGLISYVTVAAGIVVYYYKNDLKRCLIVLVPAISLLTIIKSSARIFALFITLFVLIVFRDKIFSRKSFRNRFAFKAFAGIGVLGAAQFLIPSLWNIYITKAFPNIALEDNKFPSTFSGLMSMFGSKDKTFLRNIASMMYEKLTDLSDPVIVILLASEIFVLCVIVATLIVKKRPVIALTSFISANLVYFSYITEMYLLYGFIFPEWESEILASFYRYLSTGVAIAVSILLLGGVYQITKINGKVSRPLLSSAALVVVICFCVGILGEHTIHIVYPEYEERVRMRIDERVEYSEIYAKADPIIPDRSAVMIFTEDTSFFAFVIPVFELCTSRYTVVRPPDLTDTEAVKKKIAGMEYIFATDNADMFFNAVTGIEGVEVKDDIISDVYRIDTTSDSLVLIPVS